jgi:hypothetical protein
MPKLIIKRSLYCPQFGLKGWANIDYETPLVFYLQGAESKIFLDEGIRLKNYDFDFTTGLRFELHFPQAKDEYVRALKSRGKISHEFAKTIYEFFLETNERLEIGIRVFGGAKNLFWHNFVSFNDFFNDRTYVVEWEIENKAKGHFVPKIPTSRKRWDLFKSAQLVTPAKWKKIQEGIHGSLPTKKVAELYRIWSKLQLKPARFAVLEAAILYSLA